jgi:predicted DNA-binding transcriptional regulator AlpA
MAGQHLRFKDLQGRKIVNNRTTLRRWEKEQDFPAGIMLGPRSRAWTEQEIDAWLDRRSRAQQSART